jgi:hypothetical protein
VARGIEVRLDRSDVSPGHGFAVRPLEHGPGHPGEGFPERAAEQLAARGLEERLRRFVHVGESPLPVQQVESVRDAGEHGLGPGPGFVGGGARRALGGEEPLPLGGDPRAIGDVTPEHDDTPGVGRVDVDRGDQIESAVRIVVLEVGGDPFGCRRAKMPLDRRAARGGEQLPVQPTEERVARELGAGRHRRVDGDDAVIGIEREIRVGRRFQDTRRARALGFRLFGALLQQRRRGLHLLGQHLQLRRLLLQLLRVVLRRGAGLFAPGEQPLHLVARAGLVGDVEREVDHAGHPSIRVPQRLDPQVEPGVLEPRAVPIVAYRDLERAPPFAGGVHAVEHLEDPLALELGERLAHGQPRDVPAAGADALVRAVHQLVPVGRAHVQGHGRRRAQHHRPQVLALGGDGALHPHPRGRLGDDAEHRGRRAPCVVAPQVPHGGERVVETTPSRRLRPPGARSGTARRAGRGSTRPRGWRCTGDRSPATARPTPPPRAGRRPRGAWRPEWRGTRRCRA